jgi:hypothetical protein
VGPYVFRLDLPSKIAQEDKSRDILQHAYGDMDVDQSKCICFDEFSSYYLSQCSPRPQEEDRRRRSEMEACGLGVRWRLADGQEEEVCNARRDFAGQERDVKGSTQTKGVRSMPVISALKYASNKRSKVCQ